MKSPWEVLWWKWSRRRHWNSGGWWTDLWEETGIIQKQKVIKEQLKILTNDIFGSTNFSKDSGTNFGHLLEPLHGRNPEVMIAYCMSRQISWISISKVTLEHLQKLKICPTVSTRHHLLGSSLWVSDTSHDSPCKNCLRRRFPHLTRSPQYCKILTRGWGASPPASWSTSPQSLSSGPLDLPRQRVALKISKVGVKQVSFLNF